MKDRMLEFLKENEQCVLATINKNGLPEAATVGFSQNNRLELVIATSPKTRKHKNMLNNPNVALVVGFEGSVTVQYEGKVSLIKDGEFDQLLKQYFEKLPAARKFKDESYFLIKPTWIRYSDFSQSPKLIEELREFS
jgi:uncharacterized protein YhbP (UPF0306 family)